MTGAQATEQGDCSRFKGNVPHSLFYAKPFVLDLLPGTPYNQQANALGATVIGTVSIEEKAAQAKEDGCHHIIIYTQEDFVATVSMITSGKGVDVVYNSLGKDTFQ
ncbi:hypothetical protein IFM89_011639, partial [Coptis chinensis]